VVDLDGACRSGLGLPGSAEWRLELCAKNRASCASIVEPFRTNTICARNQAAGGIDACCGGCGSGATSFTCTTFFAGAKTCLGRA
jgi:hypothetical protein